MKTGHRPVYSNDRKAPRMRKGEFSKMVITKDLYKRFLQEFPEHSEVTWREFCDNWMEIAEVIRHESIHNPLGVKLGAYTGELKLQYLPYNLPTDDRKGSQDAGEKLKNLNLILRGKTLRIKWERRAAVKRNKILQFYAFDETRAFHKIAYEYVLEHHDRIRTANVTISGNSVWRQKKKPK